MILAQYEIALPTDYDMGIIRRRVAERGTAMDDRAGLGLKAYAIRDVADGATLNAYAPFYLWRHAPALAAFHWGGQGFSGIVRDFGRPVVRTWVGGDFTRGDAFDQAPSYAMRRVRRLPDAADPVEAAAELARGGELGGAETAVHSQVWGIDPATWESVEFTLLSARPDREADGETAIYQVLHLSAPELQEVR